MPGKEVGPAWRCGLELSHFRLIQLAQVAEMGKGWWSRSSVPGDGAGAFVDADAVKVRARALSLIKRGPCCLVSIITTTG